MMLRKPELVICDLDGTLVDSAPDIAAAIDDMAVQLGLPKRGLSSVSQWIGNGVDNLIKRALTNEMYGEPDPALFTKALSMYKKIYNEYNGKNTIIYPGVREGLAWLKSQGCRLGCITNKSGQFTAPLLKQFGMYDDFGVIISGDTLPQKKPDPRPLLHAAEHFKIVPKNALMIGDSVNDVQAARAAGFQIIGVSYGYNYGRPIHTANPDVVIDSMAELPKVIAV